jgi:hypothetical protein
MPRKPARELNEKQVELVMTALVERGYVACDFDDKGYVRYQITPVGCDYFRGLLFERVKSWKVRKPKRRK